jgi:WD40 repeat protein
MKSVLVLTLLILSAALGAVIALDEDYKLVWSNDTTGWVENVAISDDGNYIAVGSQDTQIYLFDREGNELWSTPTLDHIPSISITHDGSYVAAASDDGEVYFLDKKGSILWSDIIGEKGVILVSVTGDGKYVTAAVSNPENRVFFFKGVNGEGTFLWREKFGDEIVGLDTSFNGSYITFGTYDGLVFLYSDDDEYLWSTEVEDFGINSVSISADGSHVAVGTINNSVYLLKNYNDVAGQVLWGQKIEGELELVTILKEDSTVVAQSTDNVLHFFSFEGDNLGRISLDESVGRVSLSGDGSSIAAASKNPQEKVYFFTRAQEVPEPTPKPEHPQIMVVANSIDFGFADDLFEFLNENNVTVIHATAQTYSQEVTGEKFVVILGGPDAPEGIGEIAQSVLSDDEADLIRIKGAKKIFIKSKTTVIAGSDRKYTRDAHQEFRGTLISEITGGS